MSFALPLNEDQRDCLQEITNVAMGAAAESLADLTHTFVNLPIPCIRCVDPDTFIESLKEVSNYKQLSSISQIFKLSSLNCYALIVINDESLKDLTTFTGHSIDDEGDIEKLLHDLCHTINTTCFSRLSEMIENPIQTGTPIINNMHVPLESISIEEIQNTHQLVTVEINYHIENNPFTCDLVLLFPEDSLGELTCVLNRLI